MSNKVYTIRKYKSGVRGSSEYLSKGTLEELIKYHGYTLECGHSWNNKINMHPKTIRGLVTALNKSKQETECGSMNVTTYELVND